MSENSNNLKHVLRFTIFPQGNVATRFRYGGTFGYYIFFYKFTAEPALKDFLKIGQHLAKLR